MGNSSSKPPPEETDLISISQKDGVIFVHERRHGIVTLRKRETATLLCLSCGDPVSGCASTHPHLRERLNIVVPMCHDCATSLSDVPHSSVCIGCLRHSATVAIGVSGKPEGDPLLCGECARANWAQLLADAKLIVRSEEPPSRKRRGSTCEASSKRVGMKCEFCHNKPTVHCGHEGCTVYACVPCLRIKVGSVAVIYENSTVWRCGRHP